MLVLHVGPHKTATTWLQYNFHHNRKALEEAGWLYPQTGVRVRVAHHDLSDKPDEVLDPDGAKARDLKRIADKATKGDLHILLSSEGFRHWRPEHLRALRALMAPHSLRVVYCLRDPVSKLYSFWAQQVRNGGQLSFPDYSSRQLRAGLRSRVLNPLVEIGALETLEDTELVLLTYDEIRRRKLDIFDVFVEGILGLPRLPHSDAARSNDRQPLEMTEFMRLVLARLATWNEDVDVSIGNVFNYMLPQARQAEIIAAVGAVRSARRSLTIDRDLPVLLKIEQKLLDGYRDHMLPPPAGRLFQSGPLECDYYDQQELLADPKVAGLLDEVCRTFRPGGPRIWVMNWSRFWLSLYRRIVNAFRL